MLTAALGVLAPPASAADYTGLRFYAGPIRPENQLLHYESGPVGCTTLPPTATAHVGFSNFRSGTFYQSPDRTGQQWNMGVFRSYPAGYWTSFQAS